jgi:ribosomal protein L18
MANGRPRLSVHRSNKNISVQLIDDADGKTLASASSLESALGMVGKNNVEAAAKVGAAIAERAKKAGVEECYLRPWRFSVPRPGQGAGRCRARGRAEVLREGWATCPPPAKRQGAGGSARLDDPGALCRAGPPGSTNRRSAAPPTKRMPAHGRT